MMNEMMRPRKRSGHFRRRKGMITTSGPYMGQKKMAGASGSLKKLWREGWSMGVCIVWCMPHCQKGQITRMLNVTASMVNRESLKSIDHGGTDTQRFLISNGWLRGTNRVQELTTTAKMRNG